MYGLKYIVQFNSSTGKDVKISIYKDGYSGTSSVIPATSSIKLEFKEEDYVKGSALTMVLVSQTDGALQEFYTTNNKLFKVEVNIDNVIQWSGFILPELYSESCIKAPYDVTVTATDALATLKNYTYTGTNTNKSLLAIIKKCIAETSLELDFEILNTIRYSTMGENESLYQFININDSAYNGKNMYDVLTSIMKSTNATIRQKNNKWFIYRDFDLYEGRDILQIAYSSLAYTSKRDIVTNNFGNASNNKNYPVGYMNMQIVPANHILETELTYLTKSSFLLNGDFGQNINFWSRFPSPALGKVDYIGEVEIDGVKVNKNLVRIIGYDDEYEGISQEIIGVEADGTTENTSLFTLKIEYITQNARSISWFDLEIKNYNSTQTKYLTMDGWSDNEGHIKINCTDKTYLTYCGDLTLLNNINFNTSTISFQNIPLTGTLSVKITWAGKPLAGYTNDLTSAIMFINPKLFIKQVLLYRDDLVTNIKTSMLLNEAAATDADTIKIDFADSNVSVNEDFVFLNYINNSNTATTAGWCYKTITDKDYYILLSNDYANKFSKKYERKQGVLNNYSLLNCDILKDTYNNKKYKIKSLGINLYSDDSDVTLDEYFDYDTIYSTEVVEQGSSSGGSGSSSSSGESMAMSGFGGYAPYTHDHSDQLIRPAIFVMPDSAPAEGTMGEGELAFYYSLEGTGAETPEDTPTITVDSAMDTTSTNPVQNKVIVAALRDKVDAVIGKGLSTYDFSYYYKNYIDTLMLGGGSSSITVDDSMDASSENPVQNKVIVAALRDKYDATGGTISGNVVITGTLTINGNATSASNHTITNKLKMGTLVMPNAAPTDLSSGEVAFYYVTTGTGAETPGLPADWIGDYYTKTEVDDKLRTINANVKQLENRVTALENA